MAEDDANLKEIVVPRQEAVFWMDERGRWHNQHGPFEHKKVIEYFNAAIKWDEHGYFVCQNNGVVHEKVYFHYVETALFAVDILWEKPSRLMLNTGQKILLAPDLLYIQNDHLYYRKGEHEIVKFSDRAMLKISEKLEEKKDGYFLKLDGNDYIIRTYGE